MHRSRTFYTGLAAKQVMSADLSGIRSKIRRNVSTVQHRKLDIKKKTSYYITGGHVHEWGYYVVENHWSQKSTISVI